jgi:hypothetical protein
MLSHENIMMVFVPEKIGRAVLSSRRPVSKESVGYVHSTPSQQ